MKAYIKILWVGLLIFSLTSCAVNGIKGNGNVIAKSRVINSDFNAIEAGRGIDVYITTGEKISVDVEADQNLHDLITTEVENGTLYISAKENIFSAKARKVYVSLPEIIKIKATSGSDIYSENTISGSELKIKATSGADVKLRVNVRDLKAESASGSDIILTGKAENLVVSASSGSDIRAYDLTVKNCIANATSGSDIKVNVSQKIDAKASSGADIKYKGNPEVVLSDESSSGDIKKVG